MRDVSVVVCARNAASTLDACLQSIQRSGPAEIIVIDNRSTDDTALIACLYTDRVYWCDAEGMARVRQFGLEKAGRPYISFIDSDVVLPEGTLACMMMELIERGWAGIHAQIRAASLDTYWEWAEDRHFDLHFNREGERDSPGTGAGIFRRDILLDHGFDPFFIASSEDGDLFHRIRRDGHKLGISSAYVYHHHRAHTRGFMRQRYGYGQGSARFFWKYRSFKALLGPSMMAGYGCLACLRERSPRLLPYYLAWSLAGNAGLMRGLWELAITRGGKRVSTAERHA